MNPFVLAAAAAAATWLAIPGRKVPARVGALLPAPRSTDRPRRSPVSAIGRWLRARAGRRPDPVADRRAGVVAVVVLSMLVVDPVLPAVVATAVGLGARWRRLRVARRDHFPTLAVDLPDLIDLLGLTTGAGLTVPASLPVLARWSPPALRVALVDAHRSLTAGVAAVDALADLDGAWGEPARPLVRTIADHLRHGTPLAPALERLGADARARRRRAAETRARRLPVLLLFPLVVCTLPAFGLLTVAPIVAGTLSTLDEGRLEASASLTLQMEDPSCTPTSSSPTSPPCRSSIGVAGPPSA